MGCVLGKTTSGQRKARRDQKNDARRSSENDEVTMGRRGKKKKMIEEVPTAADSKWILPAAVPEFKLKTGSAAAADEWPPWLLDVAGHAIQDWKPRRANTFEKLDKIGQGTYSNVYKARDLITGKVVALKKVRFDNLDPETVRFMSREILVLRRLDHPNVIKLEGLVISRISCSLYLVFEYMEHDLTGLAAVQTVKFTEPQIKCYMKQLLSGLEHCHNNGVLHRDIKCSNLLIDNEGILKIADFGLASFFDPQLKKQMTSRVVTLWYRPPELLLGATYYGVGVDLWSAGCILAELLAGKPILRGRTEVEQLHKVFKLCGSPSDEYWKRSRFTNATLYKPQQPYKRCITDTFKDFPSSSLALIENLLAIDPDARGTATAALNSEFFATEPYACEPSSLPKFPPSKEMDIKLKAEEARRRRGIGGKPHVTDGNRRTRVREKVSRAIPAPEANAELQTNLNLNERLMNADGLDEPITRTRSVSMSNVFLVISPQSNNYYLVQRLRVMSAIKSKSKSEKFPPPHQDGAVGHHLNSSQIGPKSFSGGDPSFSSSVIETKPSRSFLDVASKSAASARSKKKEEPQRAPPRRFINAFYPSSISWSMDYMFRSRRAA